MEARLVHGASRIAHDDMRGSLPSGLRDEQVRVFADFATYLTDVATRPPSDRRPPFCRIILPPRTGKTVIAGHIIDRAGLIATFIVPTRALLDQTVRELGGRMPGVAIGSYCGEHSHVVDHGINVVTYAMLQTHAAELPAEIRRAALVFVDEAHHAMTPSRSAILSRAFDPLALRVALTATPDYGGERRLAHYFPDLIHEITLDEAMALDLLAPLRVWVAEVDADGSRVRFVAGDFQIDDLGRLMSSAPFFRAVEVFRYDPENAHLPCLIACTSRQQAYDLFQYLGRHRPRGAPAPVLVLGDTAREDRERSLARFEGGAVDTIIQVGVLVEGWSSPHCKLLLDLAPSMSRVRATQKYFRVMTRHGSQEARIVVMLPADLPAIPVLPMDLFGGELGEYVCGQLVGRPATGTIAPILRSPGTPIAGVELKSRIVVTGAIDKPTLDPSSPAEIRQVLETNPEFNPETCGVYRFAGLWFRHRRFTGRGDFLLRWLKVPMTRDGYDRWLGRLYPEASANRILAQQGERYPDRWCANDVRWFLRALCKPSLEGRPEEPFASTWYAISAIPPRQPESPEARCIVRQDWNLAFMLLSRLKRRRRMVLIHRYGLFGAEETTLSELSELAAVSCERVRQILKHALSQLRWWRRFAESSDVLRVSPDSRILADATQRQADIEATRIRRLDELFAQQDVVWEAARRELSGRSPTEHHAAGVLLRELREAADRHGARSAFEIRVSELRARTSRARRFWRRWAEQPGAAGPDPQ